MSQTISTPFHLAFAVTDIAETEAFFVSLLGCKVGRRAERWIDFDFFGHQLSAHLVDGDLMRQKPTLLMARRSSRHFAPSWNGKPGMICLTAPTGGYFISD